MIKKKIQNKEEQYQSIIDEMETTIADLKSELSSTNFAFWCIFASFMINILFDLLR
jgi:hypothetical protein